jgi:MFS family permease
LLGAVLGTAAAIGPAIGAWMIAHFHWRMLFIANVPILAASWLTQPPLDALPRDVRARRSFDWIGSSLIGAALVLLTLATRANAPGIYVVAGIAAVILLIVCERRAAEPVLRLSLFRLRGFVTGAGVIATQNFAMYSLLTLVPFAFSERAGGAQRLGVALTAMTATMAAASPIGGWCVEWVGARIVVIAGGLIGAAGVAGLARLGASAGLAQIALALLLVGVGIGLSTGPAQSVALTSVTREQSGVASATVSMVRYLGAITGTALLAITLAPGARPDRALWIFAGAFVASAALGAAFTRDGRADGVESTRPV